MQDRLAKELENIGFSDKESRVYLAALELGPATAQQVAAKATVNRPTTYVAIESLIKRGLMSSIQKGKKRFFVAEPPETLVSVLKQQKQELKTKEEAISSIMGDLRILSLGSKDRPQVVFYEGREGIERMREQIRATGILAVEEFANIDHSYDEFPPSEDDHRQWFRKNKKIRLIYSSQNGIELPSSELGVTRKRISYEKYPFESDISVNGPLLSIVHFYPLIGVQIFNAGMARTMSRLFDLAWDNI
jgi:sugar-specific transcriptional regulator TrmB